MCVLNKVENARVKGNTCAYAWWCVYLVPFQCLPFVSVVCRYVVCGRPVARIRSSTHHIFISIQKTKTDAKPKTKKIRAREKTSRISIAVFPPKKTNRRFTNLEITQGVRISEYTCIWVNSVFTTWKQTKKSSDDVRFGSVRFGSVRFGSVRSSVARSHALQVVHSLIHSLRTAAAGGTHARDERWRRKPQRNGWIRDAMSWLTWPPCPNPPRWYVRDTNTNDAFPTRAKFPRFSPKILYSEMN